MQRLTSSKALTTVGGTKGLLAARYIQAVVSISEYGAEAHLDPLRVCESSMRFDSKRTQAGRRRRAAGHRQERWTRRHRRTQLGSRIHRAGGARAHHRATMIAADEMQAGAVIPELLNIPRVVVPR